jgi:hypothetical protein
MNRASTTLLVAAITCLIAASACAPGESADVESALATITTEDLVQHIEILSADDYEGRLPSTPSEEKTLEYLKAEFEKLGLEPGNGDSWFQEVPLVSITADPNMTLNVSRDAGRRTVTDSYSYGGEIMAWTTRVVPHADVVDSEMVFVGYGIVAPEYGWDDYAGVDVRG